MPHTSADHGHEQRFGGVLLHPTSLPGPYGIGDLGDELIVFLDWAVAAGARIWQVLPLNPPGYGNSPYGCLSSFAGNPMLISPLRLQQDGWITVESLAESPAAVPRFADDFVEFERAGAWKWGLLREAWSSAREKSGTGACPPQFIESERAWLDDFALYMALKHRSGGRPWWAWGERLARREPRAMESARTELADDIDFHQFVQFLFAEQWTAVRAAAKARGIRVMGDVPIYVAQDSADVWSNRELFQLDDDGQPTVVAGVPPDYFSATGQRWGNPLYRWDVLRQTGYAWWIERVRANLRLADIIRLDHFRGFAAYWEIPAREPTAVHGRWMPGPGISLFEAMREALGVLPLVAEDLGFITPEVDELRRAVKLPGMKILQFGFGQLDSPHLPHRYDPASVVYTGTHDNDTARGWFETAPPEEQLLARAYLGEECHDIAWSLIRAAYTSVAETAIIPVQDILGLGSEARMNRPGHSHDNWSWRLPPGALIAGHAERLRRLAEISGRV